MKCFYFGGLSLILLLSSCMMQLSESSIDQNTGINGGFEQVKNNLPVNWLVYTQQTIADADFDMTFDQADFKEGRQSIKFSVRKCGNTGGNLSPGLAQEIPVKAGDEYTISFWLKNMGAEYSVHSSAVDAMHQLDGPMLHASDTIPDWRQFQYTYIIPEGMNKFRIEINVLSPGTLWIDDIQLSK